MSQVDIPGLPLNTTPPSDSLFEISNSGVSESTRLQDVVFGLQETSEKDQANGYAGLDAGGLLAVSQIPDLSATYQVITEKDAANGYAGLDGTGLLKLSAYPAGNALEFLRRNAANTGLEFAATGSVSPLTTKGDIFGFDTANARIPVGTDGQVLTANSAQALGVEYTTIIFPADTPWTVDHDAAGFRLVNVSQYETNATNPAASGTIRLGDLESIAWRNQANDGDFSIVSNDIELQFNDWQDISFIEAIDVSFPNAQVVMETLQLTGAGTLDANNSQFFALSELQFDASNRNDPISLGNAQIISWEKTVPVNGAISITTNASDNFVIQRSASEAGAFVEEYIFSTTELSLTTKNLSLAGGFIDLLEITLPANPAANVGRLYTKDVSTITHLFFLDTAGTETDLLQSVSPLTTKGDLFTYDTGNQRLAVGADTFVLTADSAEATGIKWAAQVGGSQTPWVADIDADGFDLTDLSNIEFRATTGAPADSVPYILLAGSNLSLNVAVGNNIRFQIDGNAIVRVVGINLEVTSGGQLTQLSQMTFSFVNNWIKGDSGSGLTSNAQLGGGHLLQVDGSLEYNFNATQADFLGNNLTNLVLTTSVTVANSLSWADGIRQTFNPNATNAGINVGAHTAEPSSPTNGDLFYDSTALALKARINGVWTPLGTGASPLTTKGDLFTYTTMDERLPVGADTFVLTADSAQAAGIKWAAAAAASQTPWVSNIDAASFNLFDFSFLESNATNPATVGALRLGDEQSIAWRNSGNTADNELLAEDPDLVIIGFTTFASDGSVTTVDFFGAVLNIDGIVLNSGGSGTFNAGDRPFNSMVSITYTASGRTEEISLGNTQEISWQKAISANGWIGLSTNASDEFVIGIATSAAGATVDEYSFSATSLDIKSNTIIGIGGLTIDDGIRITFNPNATNAGLNVGLQSDPDPTSPVNGDIYYNSTNDKFRAYENSVWVDMIGGGGGSQTPWTSNIDAASFNLFDFEFLASDAADVAQAGTLRLGNLQAISWRDAANTGNHILLADADDNLTTQMSINGLAGDLIFKRINFEHLRLTGFGISVTGQADIDTFINLTEIATPANPAANDGRIYAKDVSTVTHLFFLDSAGTETDLLVGLASPLTTKGDLFTFTSVDARLPVGTDGFILSANSAQATGLEWIANATGDVTGPGVAGDDEIPVFSGTSGKVLKRTGSPRPTILSGGVNARWFIFTADGSSPGAVNYLRHDGGDVRLNAQTGGIALYFANTAQYNISASLFDMNNSSMEFTGGFIDMFEIATPANPASNYGRIYVKDVSTVTQLFFRDSVGTETQITGAGGDVVGPGSSADTELVRFSGTSGKIIQATSVPVLMTSAGEPTWPRAILFTNFTGGLPAASTAYIQNLFSDLTLNVSTGNQVQFSINAATTYQFSSTNFIASNININIISAYYQMTSIVSPASTGNVAIGRLFLDSDNSHHLTIQRNGVEVDLEGIGAQTPWTSDIEAATFDLNNLGNLNFSLTGATGIPAATEPFITWDDTLTPDAMRFNVPASTEYALYINAVEEYTFDNNDVNFHNNGITDVGNLFQDTLSAVGISIWGRTNEVTGQDAAEFRFNGGNTQYAEIRVNMLNAVAAAERGTFVIGVKVGNTTTIDDVITITGGTTATSTTLSFNNTLMGSNIEMNSNLINNVLQIRSADANEAGVGFIRMGDTELLGWRNAADSADHTIGFSADVFNIVITSGTDYSFSETAFNVQGNEMQNVGMFNYITDNELTIATGAITITRSYFNIDTEANAATDDLDTINGGVTGRVIVIRANNAARTVVVKDGTGNIQCAGDFSMDNIQDIMTLIFDGTNWLEISRSDNGA